MNLNELRKPFPIGDTEWRIQQSGLKGNKPWGKVLAYITNRAIMERLDDVCGPGNWANQYDRGPEGGILCGISINVDGVWVTKWDGADNTTIEATKGGLSGSMKRAGVQWGIGRYLYKLEEGWANFSDSGKHTAKIQNNYFKWDPPSLPAWALPDVAPRTDAPHPQPLMGGGHILYNSKLTIPCGKFKGKTYNEAFDDNIDVVSRGVKFYASRTRTPEQDLHYIQLKSYARAIENDLAIEGVL